MGGVKLCNVWVLLSGQQRQANLSLGAWNVSHKCTDRIWTTELPSPFLAWSTTKLKTENNQLKIEYLLLLTPIFFVKLHPKEIYGREHNDYPAGSTWKIEVFLPAVCKQGSYNTMKTWYREEEEEFQHSRMSGFSSSLRQAGAPLHDVSPVYTHNLQTINCWTACGSAHLSTWPLIMMNNGDGVCFLMIVHVSGVHYRS